MDWLALLGIPVGLAMLYFGSEWMVDGAKRLALRLGVAPFVVGLTVVAFGSSAPECVTSVVSAGTPDIIIGNIVGSNIADVGLAIGLAALICPVASRFRPISFELFAMMASVAVVALMALDGSICAIEGAVLVAALLVFIAAVHRLKKGDAEGQSQYTADVEPSEGRRASLPLCVAMVAAGLALLYFGAKAFIAGAVALAAAIGISDLLVGLLVVAVGTSLPELCICVMAAWRGENEIVVSNIVGSIIFNCFFALGVGALAVDVPISHAMLTFHIPVMIGFAAMLLAFIRLRDGLSRPMAAAFVALYAAYVAAMGLVPELTLRRRVGTFI